MPAQAPHVQQEPTRQASHIRTIQIDAAPAAEGSPKVGAVLVLVKSSLREKYALPKETPALPAEEPVLEPAVLKVSGADFLASAMSRLGSRDVFGQGSGGQGLDRQGSMLPSESRKLAHLALRAKEAPRQVSLKARSPSAR